MPRAFVRPLFLLILTISAVPTGCGPTPRPVIREKGVRLSELVVCSDVTEMVLPLRLSQQLLMTDTVSINAKPAGPFAIDTGAMWTVIDRTTAVKLGLTEADLVYQDKKYTAPDGLYHVASLTVGPLTLRNHAVFVADMTSLQEKDHQLAGVVGADVLGCLPFTFDYRGKTLTLHRRSDFKPPAGVQGYPLTVKRPRGGRIFRRANPSAGVPIALATIDGVRAKILLDTGSGGSIVLNPAFIKKHPQFQGKDPAIVAHASGVTGPGGLGGLNLYRANVDLVVALGAGFRGANTATYFSARRNVLPDEGSAILGTQYLRHGRLTFDYAAKRIWPEWRPEPPPAKSH
jgi:predicted aspartyl protease